MHVIKVLALFAISVLAAPVEDSLQDVSALKAAYQDSIEDDTDGTSLYSRGPENCYQTGTSWRPNNGKVLQTINDACMKSFAGQWKKNEKVSKCYSIKSGALFSPKKSMWLELQNRGDKRNLSKAYCSTMLRTMFDECSKGGEYTNKYGWFIKADPISRDC